MEEVKYICPCCGTLTGRRTTPITEAQAFKSYGRMLERGFTRQQLLTEQAEALDYIAPGMTDYLRRIEYDRPGVPAPERPPAR